LISQRRRWLNAYFFAAIRSTVVHFHCLYRSSHVQPEFFMVFSSKPLPLSVPYTSHLMRIRTTATSSLSFSEKRSSFLNPRQPAERTKMGLYPRVHWIWFHHNCRCVLVDIQGCRECCAERRTSDPCRRFVHEFDLYRCYTLRRRGCISSHL
jgi:hypothetical protein